MQRLSHKVRDHLFRRAPFHSNFSFRNSIPERAFERIAEEWRRLGYPFEHLVPSLATSIGSSADRPAALAELMGIVVNGGIRRPTHRISDLHFAQGTPWETALRPTPVVGERVMARDFDRQVAELQVRAAILNRFTQLGTPVTVRVG